MRPNRYPYSYKHEEYEELEIKGFRMPESYCNKRNGRSYGKENKFDN